MVAIFLLSLYFGNPSSCHKHKRCYK